ncbi:MAG: hypothetical protein Fur0021_16130 [Candidatus Promineifilaceae bacterium]
MTLRQKVVGAVTANKAGAAGNEYFHGKRFLSLSHPVSLSGISPQRRSASLGFHRKDAKGAKKDQGEQGT